MTEETFRKMASIQRIEEVKSIPEADRICAYRVSGWWIVDQVGKYQVGDLIIYCCIDCFIPTTVAPFLTKPGKFPKEYLGVSGERLKTVRLRRQISQGLLLPLPVLIFDYDVVPGEICVTSEFIPDSSSGICIIDQKDGLLGLDVSSVLGILKWEPPPEFTAANARGNFPSWGKRTDQERVQNLRREVKEWYDADVLWEVTEKINGAPTSCGKFQEEFVVCSRNLSLKLDPENTYVKVADKHNLEEKLKAYYDILISGELLGPGVQGNRYSIADHDFWVFDVYDPKNGEYVPAGVRYEICDDLGLNHVPVLYRSVTLRELGLDSVDKILKFADGKSVMGTVGTAREGVVFKSVGGEFSFNAVSNEWLLKNDS